MKYSRFEDLPVWKAAMELAVRVNNNEFMSGWVYGYMRLSLNTNPEGIPHGLKPILLSSSQ